MTFQDNACAPSISNSPRFPSRLNQTFVSPVNPNSPDIPDFISSNAILRTFAAFRLFPGFVELSLLSSNPAMCYIAQY
jgi:hypothetical protein